jgi:hypothetical protein
MRARFIGSGNVAGRRPLGDIPTKQSLISALGFYPVLWMRRRLGIWTNASRDKYTKEFAPLVSYTRRNQSDHH